MFISLLYFLISGVSSSSTVDCFVDSKKCVIDQNLVETQLGVATMEECSNLCRDYLFCTAFTHFGPNSVFIPNACLLFSSCSQREPCEDCVSGTGQNECDCGIKFEGLMDPNNFIGLVPNVADESSCKKLCSGNDECDVYTFYDDQDSIKANMCFLLTSQGLQQPVTPCDHCKTGPGRCETGQKCQVAVIANSGNSETQVLLVQESTTIDFVAGEKECFRNVTVLAVGGAGSYTQYNGGGGGSGYIDYGNVTLVSDASHSAPMVVMVGVPGQSSFVEGGGINAAMGNYGGLNGGDGYSGGAGKGGHGGSNGGNGDDGESTGGKGSGLNLEHMTMTNFILTPAEGRIAIGHNGGGGGGVLVNGKGPHGDDRHGFGEGGNFNYNGNSGCVLIEI